MMKTVPRSGWVWSGHETRAWLATCARQLLGAVLVHGKLTSCIMVDFVGMFCSCLAKYQTSIIIIVRESIN